MTVRSYACCPRRPYVTHLVNDHGHQLEAVIGLFTHGVAQGFWFWEADGAKTLISTLGGLYETRIDTKSVGIG
jgi:hypothetical protein